MPHKYRLSRAEHEKLDDAMKAIYVERDGAYVLDLDVDVDALDRKVGEFRDNNLTLRREVEKFKGFDPAELESLRAKVKQFEQAGAGDPADVQKAIEKATAPLRAELDGLKNERDEAKRLVARTALEQRLWDVAVPYGVREKARADYLRRATGVFVSTDKGIEARAEDGTPLYSKKSGKRSEPLTPEEWVSEWLPEEADHLFNPSHGSGAHHDTSAGRADTRVIPNDRREVSRNLEAIASGAVTVRG